jgi:hypothetical protein
MTVIVTPQVTAVAVHRTAQSACCAAPLDRVAPGAEEFTCRGCGEPTERVYAEPREIAVRSEG